MELVFDGRIRVDPVRRVRIYKSEDTERIEVRLDDDEPFELNTKDNDRIQLFLSLDAPSTAVLYCWSQGLVLYAVGHEADLRE